MANPLLVRPEEDVFGGLLAGMTPKEAGDLGKSGLEYAGGLLDNIAEKAPGSLGRAWQDSSVRTMAQQALNKAAFYAGPHLSDRAAAIPSAAVAATENLFGNKDAREASAAFKEGKVGQGAKLLGLGSASALLDVPTLGTGGGVARGLLRGLTKAAHYTPDLSMAVAPIKAFHGSPFDFEKFDIKKIGTGEGAQAYGHGLYFAGNENVAKNYRQTLANWPTTIKSILGRDVSDDAATALQRSHAANPADPERAAKIAQWQAPDLRDVPQSDLARVVSEFSQRDRPGRMYEVGIHADPGSLIDYDAPLREQSRDVRGLLGDKGEPTRLRPQDDRIAGIVDKAVKQASRIEEVPSIIDNTKGLYDAGMAHAKRNLPAHLLDDLSPGEYVAQRAAPYLKALAGREVSGDDLLKLYRGREGQLAAAGVPGVKYLDQGSRVGGEGSRNYVTFSDDIVEILRKYGLAGAGVGLGGAMAMQPGLFPLPQQQ